MKATNIAKNTSYFTLALVLQKVISFTYFTILARNLVPEDLGKYYFAISFTAIFSIFIDLGLANVLTREVAKAKERSQNLLSSVLALKIPLAALSLLSVVLIINLLGYPDLTRSLVYLSAVCMILDSFTLSMFACIRGWHNLKFESIAVIIFQLIAMSFGLAAIKLDMGLIWIMGALIAASSFNFIYSISLIRFRWKIKLKPRWQTGMIKMLIKISIPFALFAIFQRLYMFLDTVLLSVLAGDAQAGLYQIAFKIIFALQFLPMAFMASLYPAFAGYWKRQKESSGTEQCSVPADSLVVSFERAMNYLIIISIPISIGIIILADRVILFFKPEYISAVLPLQLVMASLFFIFLNFPIGALLNACDRQKINTRNMGITLAVSVVLNIILIPRFQATGAAVTVIATNMLMFVLGACWVPKIIKVRPRKILITFFKAFFAAGMMAALAFWLKFRINIFFVILLAGPFYFMFLFLLGGFRKEDVISIWQSFGKNR